MGWQDYLPGNLITKGFDAAKKGLNKLTEPRSEGQYGGVDRSNFDLPGFRNQQQREQRLGGQYGADAGYWSGQQRGVADQYNRMMRGENSLAQLQLRQATDANQAQQRSMAASAAPGNTAMAQRLAMQNVGRINQGFGNQAAQLGIQERNVAAQGLAGLAGQARGQSMTGESAAYGRGLQGSALQQQGGMGYEQQRTQRAVGQLGVPTQGENILGAIGGGLPFLMADGGVVTKPTNAIIGEEGPEAVIPLAQLPALMRFMQQGMGRPGVAGDTSDQFKTVTTQHVVRPEELSRPRFKMKSPEDIQAARALEQLEAQRAAPYGDPYFRERTDSGVEHMRDFDADLAYKRMSRGWK